MDYCNVQGHNLEESQESLEATKGLLKTKSIHYPQQASILFGVINTYFKMEAYPSRDKGVFGQLLRFVDMHHLFHQRIVAGQDAINHVMDQVVCMVSGTLDQIRKHELKVRLLVDLDERARRTEPRERDNQAALRIAQNHTKGTMVGHFANEATRTFTVGQLTNLQKEEG